MKKQVVASALASSLLLGMITTTGFAETSGTSFKDINNSYAKDAIMELQSKGILNGIGNEQFNPKGTLTRAEFVTVIVKALGLETDNKISSFNDVSDWAIPYVETAFKLEIINGVGQGKFAPNAPITREMAVVILVRALQSAGVEIELIENAPLHFTDANLTSDWARAYVSAGYKLGLIKGNPDGSFDPKGNTNREMSAVLGKNLLTAIENTPKPSEPEQKPDETKPETKPETPAPSVPSAPPSNGGGGGIYVPPAQPSGDLATAKTTAKGQLDSYVDPADYITSGTALTDAITTGKANIDAATDEAGVTSALAAAKSAIDAIKSDADLAADALATAKTTAKGQLDSYVDPADYTTNGTALTDAITTGKANIDAATDEAGVTSALAAAKSAIDAIKSDADLAADALATAKTTAKGQLDSYVDPANYATNGTALTNAITTGKANIDAATDEAGVTSALAAAKSAIDAIKSDADLAADALATAKTTAKGQLDSYVDPADYATYGTALTDEITTGKANIDAATDEAGVTLALEAAKSAIDEIKSRTAEVSFNDNGQPITSLPNGQIWRNFYVKLTKDKFNGQPVGSSTIIFGGDFTGLSLNGTRLPENDVTTILDGVNGTITNNSGKGTITIKGSVLQSRKDLTITIDVISAP